MHNTPTTNQEQIRCVAAGEEEMRTAHVSYIYSIHGQEQLKTAKMSLSLKKKREKEAEIKLIITPNFEWRL